MDEEYATIELDLDDEIVNYITTALEKLLTDLNISSESMSLFYEYLKKDKNNFEYAVGKTLSNEIILDAIKFGLKHLDDEK